MRDNLRRFRQHNDLLRAPGNAEVHYDLGEQLYGHIPALSEITPSVERAGLIVTDIEALRLHCAETLACWRARFAARREEAKAPYGERLCRMWEFYLAGSGAAREPAGLLAPVRLQRWTAH